MAAVTGFGFVGGNFNFFAAVVVDNFKINAAVGDSWLANFDVLVLTIT